MRYNPAGKRDGRQRTKRILFRIVILVVLLMLSGCGDSVIGRIKGPEWDSVVVDDVEYVRTFDSGISRADRGDYLGKVTDGETVFRVYAVKGDPDGAYLYCFWDWEGLVYERKPG